MKYVAKMCNSLEVSILSSFYFVINITNSAKKFLLECL